MMRSEKQISKLLTYVLAASGLALCLTACDSQVFVRNGVTDGSSFSIPPAAAQSKDPVVQSWIAYSLARSACQVAMGGDNPARNHSFDCELRARKVLLQSWQQTSVEQVSAGLDPYLDELQQVHEAEFLYEYIWRNFRKSNWEVPARLHMEKFKRWQRQNLPQHKVQTRLIGSWSYPPNSAR